MASIKTKDIDIPEETINSWQKMLNFVAEITGVTASLIMKVDPPYMEVIRSSQSEDNPYNIGDKEKLPGLYCEFFHIYLYPRQFVQHYYYYTFNFFFLLQHQNHKPVFHNYL